MKKIVTIWQSLAIATMIVTILYLCSSCTETSANTNNNAETEIDYLAEDNYCLAESEGIVLQDVQFINGCPFYKGKPVVLTPDSCEVIASIFSGQHEEYPVAAVAYDCKGYYIVDLD